MIRGLYAITNESLMPGAQLLAKTEAALAGGCRIVQYRNKSADWTTRCREAAGLRTVCRRHDALLIINDSPELALAVEADGVHLGQDDLPVGNARRLLGVEAIVGATCHASTDLAVRAADDGASYLAFGRFFPSQTKPLAPPARPELLQQVKQGLHLPTVAIGGIDMDNAATLIAAGADCLAVSHDLFRGDNLDQIEQRAARFTSLFNLPEEPQ